MSAASPQKRQLVGPGEGLTGSPAAGMLSLRGVSFLALPISSSRNWSPGKEPLFFVLGANETGSQTRHH